MSRRVRHGRTSRRRGQDAELNVTAFMNLMVALVPFLLLMAVFTRLTIVQLNLPSSKIEDKPEPPAIELEAILRADRIDLEDRGKALISSFPKKEEQYDFKALTQKLREIKTSFPDIKAISVLPEEDVNYDNIIKAMDAVRSLTYRQDDKLVEAELFPDISLGKAPVIETSVNEMAGASQ
ncbi:MAG TPA: biopolymer transporter ExbD [Chromatiales bacterium]|nr:biopolymer transporter ExbD [Thiotrichales bacterium]HIP68284.1 biopolymer transporter ExbD [Chromatiales bacterium]